MKQSFLVAAVHALLVAVVWINYAWEQRSLPRAWAQTAPVDPYDLLRGRYVSLSVLARTAQPMRLEPGKGLMGGELYVQEGQLFARPAECCVTLQEVADDRVRVVGRLSYFFPEGLPDPSALKDGEELWAEVTIPPKGRLRPLRLAVKAKDGAWKDWPGSGN